MMYWHKAPYQMRTLLCTRDREIRQLVRRSNSAMTRATQAEEEIAEGDYWMERHTNMMENGGCPVCYQDDESIGTHRHKERCEFAKLEEERDDYRNQYHMAEAKVSSRDALLEQLSEEQLTKDIAKAEEEIEALKEAVELALVLLGHADFRNGNTDPGGVMDEGEVHAGRLMDKIQALVPEIYAEALKKT